MCIRDRWYVLSRVRSVGTPYGTAANMMYKVVKSVSGEQLGEGSLSFVHGVSTP